MLKKQAQAKIRKAEKILEDICDRFDVRYKDSYVDSSKIEICGIWDGEKMWGYNMDGELELKDTFT